MRKQMKAMEEKNASYMQQTIDLQEVRRYLCLFISVFVISGCEFVGQKIKGRQFQGKIF